MVKSHHVIYLSLMVVVGLLASLVTLVATSGNPYANIELAHAQSMGNTDVVAVPIGVGGGNELLAVISKISAPSVAGGGGEQAELALAIYKVDGSNPNDAQLRWMGTRRIEYDLKVPAYGLAREQMQARSGTDLTPAGVRSMVESWRESGGEGGRRR